MPRVKKGRHASKPCLTCLIVCIIVILILGIGITVGSVLAFNHFVSPMIGGVKFGDSVKIIHAIRHSNRKKIIDKENEFSVNDLNDFYTSLNSMLYQKDMTDEEYLARYEALSDEERAEMTFEEYKEANPFRIDIERLSNAMDIESLLSGNKNDDNGEVQAAGEDNENDENNNEESDNEAIANLIKELYFDFSALGNYPYLEDEEDFSYTTFEITGKQIAAVINEVMEIVLRAYNLSELEPELEGVNLKNYIGIPVISLSNVENIENNGNRNKLTITVELKLRKLLDEVVKDVLASKMNNSKIIVNIAKSLLPKEFFVTLETFPTDNNSEVNIRINNANEKTSNNMKIVANALCERFNFRLFPSENQDEVPTEYESLFKQINDKVVDVFSMINDYIPVTFVNNENGSSTLRIAHIQGLLKTLGLFDEDDIENSVTPHMFFTTLRCLFDESTPVTNNENLTSLYVQLDERYGINQEYWIDHDLLDEETLKNIPSQIDVASVQFNENEKMKVFIHDGHLTTLIGDAVKNGLFTGNTSEVAAASDDENGSNDFLSMINFESIKINKTSSQNLTNYTAKDNKVYISATADLYSLDATISITLADILNINSGDNVQENSNPILETLTKSLPQKLCLALVINIKDIYDISGELVDRFVGVEALPTTFKINNFDENYSKKVFDIITLMVSKFNSDFDFDLNNITSQIESSFATVFDTVSDNLYCNIEFSAKDENNQNKGCLVLPSIYEIVYGLSKKQVEESDELTSADLISKTEIRNLFVQIYNTHFLVLDYDQADPSDTSAYEKVLRRYKTNEGVSFLKKLSENFYLKDAFTSDDLFAGKTFNITANTLIFNGVQGLYKDTRDIKELDTSMTGDALACLINDAGFLKDLVSNKDSDNENSYSYNSENENSTDIIKSLSIVNCVYEWKGEVLYLNFEFEARLKENKIAKAQDGENNSSAFSIETFLPEKAYLTASVVMHTVEEDNRFKTELLINNSSIDNLAKLVKIFTGTEFTSDDITEQVKEPLQSIFDVIEKTFNMKYELNNNNDAIVFKNIFSTINKRSHPDSETDEEKHNDYLAYNALTDEEKEADDRALRARLQEFGRAPAYSTKTENDGSTEVKIVNYVTDVNYFSNNEDDIYSLTDIDVFFNDLNNNFYISDNNLLNADNITEINSIDSSFISFAKIYNDTRDISELNLHLTSKSFTALANKFTGYSIDLGLNSETESDEYAKAKLVQSTFSVIDDTAYLNIVILVELTSSDEMVTNLLPSHLFITAKLDLTTVGENGEKSYPVELYVNNFTEEETEDVFRRINLLETAFKFKLAFGLDDLKSDLSSEISSVLTDNFDMFGELDIHNGYIALPNIFEYLTNGTLEGSKYNKDLPMFETCALSETKGTFGIENGLAGYYDNNNFIVLQATVDGNLTNAVAVKNENNIWGYYDNENFVPIQTLPEQLMNDLRNFGRTPEENIISIPKGSNLGYSILGYKNEYEFIQTQSEKDIFLYHANGIGLAESNYYFFNNVTDENGTYYYDNSSEFFGLVNMNFYISEKKKIKASDINDENKKFTIDNSMFDFEMLYNDVREFDDMLITLDGKSFASLVNEMYKGGISVSDGYSAEVVQMKLYTKELAENTNNLLDGYSTLKTILRIELSNEDMEGTDILPSYIYITVFTVIDLDAGEYRFNSDFVINNFGYTYESNSIINQFNNTEAFINRLNVLKKNFAVNFDFDLDEVKSTIKDTFKSIFEDKLHTFGNISFTNNSLIIPNIFQYLTDGQIFESAGGKMDYIFGIEQNDDGTETDHRMYEMDGSLTDPRVLRVRLKELGNDSYTGAIKVWGSDNKYYNDNLFTKDDENAFYSDMQAFYFLSTLPSFNDLQSGTILNNLTDNIESVFNLRGVEGATMGPNIKQNYINFGLYNYTGVQAILKLSDKALASLINSQNSVELKGTMMLKELVITSVKLDYKDEYNMTIEITIKATTRDKIDGELNAMPDYFYLTTITQRTVDRNSGAINYDTEIALNGFTPDDLTKLLYNIEHIEEHTSLGIAKNFKPEDISKSVEDALAETLDSKLSEYITGYGRYDTEDSDIGLGYIKFKSIYSELLRLTKAKTGNEKDMQNVIVKLNNSNEYLDKNKYDSSNKLTQTELITRNYLTDREFAYYLNNLLKLDAKTNYITVAQVAILKGVNDAYNGYVDLINNLKDDFALTEDNAGYFLITVSIDTGSLSSSVKLAPESITITLLMDNEGNFVKYNNDTSDLSFKMIQDFTASEQDMFMSIFNDKDNSIDVDAMIEEKVKTILGLFKGQLNQSTDFEQYYGSVSKR